jgi:very-short-patch-repair endonuclease
MPHLLTVAEGRRLAARRASLSDGVLQRSDLRAWGVPRWVVKAELRAGRWQRTGRQTVVNHNGPLNAAARRRVAVAEVGPRAALDGVTALQHLGVAVLGDELIHVIIPKGSSPRRRLRGVRIHESRRYRSEDVAVRSGVRCVAPAAAAVHAALWARTDREAVYVLVLVVQQRLADPQELAEAAQHVRRHVRRRLLARTVLDLAGGVRSMGELDVARELRGRGLPEPDRQVVRRRADGREYLDCRFGAYDLTLEIDGWQHDDPQHRLADLLRDLTQVGEGSTVLRVPLVAWRLGARQILDRLERVFVARGWQRPAA